MEDLGVDQVRVTSVERSSADSDQTPRLQELLLRRCDCHLRIDIFSRRYSDEYNRLLSQQLS